MIVDCISDLHGYYPELEGGDLLIVAGDLTASDRPIERLEFLGWLSDQSYKRKIFIAGNHDNSLVEVQLRVAGDKKTEYLCDSGTELQGLKIWGSPWTPHFEGVNPRCAAFMRPDSELQAYWDLIPGDVDILVTHGPPYGILDGTWNSLNAGSHSLFMKFYGGKIKPKLHVFGHIHESYGVDERPMDIPGVKFVNCSYVDLIYRPSNRPIRIEL